MRLDRAPQIVLPARPAGTDLHADHPVDHQRVAIAPEREVLVDPDQRREEAERPLEDRLVAVEHDHQRGEERRIREPPLPRGLQRLVLRLVEHRIEGLARPVELRQLRAARALGELRLALDRRPILVEHARDVRAVLAPEVELRRAHERHPREPRLDDVEEARLALRRAHRPAVGRVERRLVVGLVVAQPLGALEAEPVLEAPELRALEPGRRRQQVAEIEEVERRHRLQDVDLVEEHALDADDPLEVVQRAPDVALVHELRAHDRDHRVELVQALLEPELVRLVGDDEQQLVVRRPAGLRALERLAGEELLELQVLSVGE